MKKSFTNIYYILVCFLMMICSLDANSQSIDGSGTSEEDIPLALPNHNLSIPVPPEVAAMTNHYSNKVNLAQGLPVIDFPLANIKSRDLSHNVTLSYNASGNKVRDLSSSAGLGWTVLAGGVINVDVKGKPDLSLGAISSGSNQNPCLQSGFNTELEYENYINSFAEDQEAYEAIDRGALNDSGADIFNFNIIGVGSGKFFIRKDCEGNHSVVMIEENQFDVRLVNIENDWLFEITDRKGNLYKFYDKSVQKVHQHSSSPRALKTWAEDIPYAATYHLTRIESPQFGLLDFEYQYYSYQYFSDFNEMFTFNPSGTEAPQYNSSLFEIDIIMGRQLKSIHSPQGEKIEFIYDDQHRGDLPNTFKRIDNEEEDLVSGKLESIVMTASGEEFSKVNFRHAYRGQQGPTNSYFRLPTSYSTFANSYEDSVRRVSESEKEYSAYENDPTMETFYYQAHRFHNNSPNANGSNSGHNRRLMLESMEINGELYSFEYNNNLLPNRFSFAVDHWGLFNGEFDNTSCIPLSDGRPSSSDYPKGSRFGERKPNFRYAKAQLLEKITYPTGGTKEFSYEPARFLERSRKTSDDDCEERAITKTRQFYFESTGNTFQSYSNSFKAPTDASNLRISVKSNIPTAHKDKVDYVHNEPYMQFYLDHDSFFSRENYPTGTTKPLENLDYDLIAEIGGVLDQNNETGPIPISVIVTFSWEVTMDCNSTSTSLSNIDYKNSYGGIRLKRIRSSGSLGEVEQFTDNYNYEYKFSQSDMAYPDYLTMSKQIYQQGSSCPVVRNDFKVLSSNSKRFDHTFNGFGVYFDQITEKRGEGGTILQEVGSSESSYKGSPYGKTIYYYTHQKGTHSVQQYTNLSIIDFEQSLQNKLTLKEVYKARLQSDEVDYQILSSESFEYETVYYPNKNIYNLQVAIESPQVYGGFFNSQICNSFDAVYTTYNYEIKPFSNRLKSSSKFHFNNTQSASLSETNQYCYDQYGRLTSLIKRGPEKSTMTKLKYLRNDLDNHSIGNRYLRSASLIKSFLKYTVNDFRVLNTCEDDQDEPLDNEDISVSQSRVYEYEIDYSTPNPDNPLSIEYFVALSSIYDLDTKQSLNNYNPDRDFPFGSDNYYQKSQLHYDHQGYVERIDSYNSSTIYKFNSSSGALEYSCTDCTLKDVEAEVTPFEIFEPRIENQYIEKGTASFYDYLMEGRLISSITDQNNNKIFYEYNNETKKLERILDNDRNVLEQFDYNLINR